MNKSTRSIASNLRKKMRKAIRNSQSGTPNIQSRLEVDTLLTTELTKKYPKRVSPKKAALISAIRKAKGRTSKRTTPGMVDAESSPAYSHREGARWIKSLTKQTSAQRKIAAHHGKKR